MKAKSLNDIANLHALAAAATARIQAMPADSRPMGIDRTRIQRIDYCASGKFEALTARGSQEYLTPEQVAAIK